MFLLANILLNYDTGVIPASLLQILKEIDLNFKEQALLGSLVYLGLSFASLFVGLIFAKYGPAKTCAYAILVNSFSCFLFSISKIKLLLFLCRFLMGISEAFIVIYGPVWVNNYSPKEHSAKWMGILHSVTALGVMVGYVFAGITINFFSHIVSWRFAIQIQGFAQIPVALFFFFEKEEYINIDLNMKNNKSDINLNLNTISEIEDSFNHRTPDRGTTPEPSNANISKFDMNNPDLLGEIKKINSNKSRFSIIDNLQIGVHNTNNSAFNKDNSNFMPNVLSDNKYSEMIIQENLIYQNKNILNNAYISNNSLHNPQQTIKLSSNLNVNVNLHNNNLQACKSKNSFGNNNNTNNNNNYSSRARKDPRIDAVETSNLKQYCNQVYIVMSNPLYMTTTMALCSIYFIVTGIQFWMTNYLIDILGNDPILVIAIFSIVSITAPLGGVIVGGTFADAYGGYRGKNTLKALKLCSAFGVIAFIFAFPIGFLYSMIYITVLLWTFLFFGAAIVPVSTGIMVSSVRR
jgi:MFS family permease